MLRTKDEEKMIQKVPRSRRMRRHQLIIKRTEMPKEEEK